MWIYRRTFACTVLLGFIVGAVIFLRMNDSRQRPTPDFLPNVARFRTSRVCSARAVVLVNSSPTHNHRRQVIRETWAHPTVTQALDISVAFGVDAADNVETQRSLDWEAEVFGDIFQLLETEKSTTAAFKAIELFRSMRSACSPVPEFIIKVDDNVFANIFAVEELLESLDTFSSSNTIWCIAWDRSLDNQRNNSVWVVQKISINNSVHPPYCSAAAYLMTSRTMDAIIRKHDSQTGKLLLPEDVYVTEVLTREAGINHLLIGERLLLDAPNGEEGVDKEKIIFAYLKNTVEEDTKNLWNDLVKVKLNLVRRTDIGL